MPLPYFISGVYRSSSYLTLFLASGIAMTSLLRVDNLQ